MNGILLLNKPKKMTSHDCVNKIRKIFHTKKVGHMGTLDPNVEGVLPICIGEATKIIQFIKNEDKEYIANISIGKSTTTEDNDGEIISFDNSYKEINRKTIINVLNNMLGEQTQIPPMFSAVKVNGKKLYEYARKNIEVERPKRVINIYELELLSFEDIFSGKEINFTIRVLCSKGTYIRTLAVDIGEKLGYPSHMNSLTRTKAGLFKLSNCSTFDEIEKNNFQLISMYKALSDHFMVQADLNTINRIKFGQKLKYSIDENYKYLVFYDSEYNVLAVYENDKKDKTLIKPVRVFNISE